MTELQSKLLEVFRKFTTPANGRLNSQSLMGEVRKWDKRSQDDSNDALGKLMNEGYIITEGRLFILTQLGFDYLNKNYKIEDTEELILNIIKKHKVGIDQIIMPQWFISERNRWERIHFEKYNEAFENIHTKCLVEEKRGGLFLTKKGCEQIY